MLFQIVIYHPVLSDNCSNIATDPSKQAQEVLFSRKLQKVSHPQLFFNNSDVLQTNFQKHIRVVLDSKLTFHDHLNIMITKVRKAIGVLRKLNSILPRAALVTVLKPLSDPTLTILMSSKIKPLILPFRISWNQSSTMNV